MALNLNWPRRARSVLSASLRFLRKKQRWAAAAAVAVAYLPVMASSPGLLGADTKVYLYLDPGRLLSRAASLWEADRALGTVTHQSIGFLWPMGPFYWLFDVLGVPDWMAQRLWLGTLLAAAGLGVRYLLRTLGFRGPGLLAAVLAYQLSPYLLHYSARISVVLLGWAGLGWMVGLTVRAARTGGWRHPALFALCVLTVGGVNLTSLVLVGLAPVLWLLHAAATDRSISAGRALATAARIGALTAGVSLWWASGLALQAAYSLPVTRFTETYQVVADASSAPEVLRGLGYWFFYGNDKFGPWIEPSVSYTQGGWLIFTSFGLAVLALGTAAVVRWRHRGYFALLAAAGTLVAVGAHPIDGSSLLGELFERFTLTDAGLAMRSLPRAVPLVALAVAVLLGAGVNALARRAPRIGAVFGAAVLAAVVLNNPAVWRLGMIEANLNFPEKLPDYWLEAAAALDAEGAAAEGFAEAGRAEGFAGSGVSSASGLAPAATEGFAGAESSRVLEIPGSDFASYRWGNTVDPITPGLMERGYAARELVPFGSAQSAALIGALDRRLQEGTLDPGSLAPAARLMSAGDVVHRADLSFERYRTPRPVETHELLGRAPGLRLAGAYGEPAPNEAGPQQTMIDEIHLARPAHAVHPAPVTRYEVSDPLPLVRTRPATGATVLAGDADGIVDAAAAGVLDLRRPLVFAADLMADADMAGLILAEPAHVIVTDTNRRRAQRWGTLRENRGHTEQAGEEALVYDPTDNRLPVFDRPAGSRFDRPAGSPIGAGEVQAVRRAVHPDDVHTVSEQRGPLSAQATAYGNPVTYTNDDRAYYAVDGSPDTAWVVAAFAEARGERLRIRLAEPTFLESVRLLQPSGRGERHIAEANRRITEVEIRADGRTVNTAALDGRSLAPPGQSVALGVEAEVIDIEITDTDVTRRAVYPGIAPVGFAEVDLGLGPVVEVIRTPRALVDSLGDGLDAHALTVVLTRERSNPREPVRVDPEPRMRRFVPLPSARTASVTGTARLSAAAASEVIDSLLGMGSGPGPTATSLGRPPKGVNSPLTGQPAGAGPTATSSGRLPGDLASRAASVLDGDPNTSWTGRFGPQAGQWIELAAGAEPFSAASVEIDVVVDEEHSTPISVRVWTDGADRGSFDLGLTPAADGTPPRSTVTVSLPLAVSATTIRIAVEEADERLTRDWYSNGFVALPVSVAEVRAGDMGPRALPSPVDTGCRGDLLWVDGAPVPVRVTGAASDAVARRGLRLEGCAPAALAAGGSMVVTAPGAATGLDIDQLVLDSPRPVAAHSDGIGAVRAVRGSDTRYTVEVPESDADRWLVLGQSHNRGWRAVADGVDLGPPVVMDGFANAWLLPAHDTPATVELRWAPQRLVDWALRASAAFVALALLLAVRGRPDRGPSLRSGRVAEPARPALCWPWEMTGTRPPPPAPSAAVAGVVAVLAAANLPTARWWHLLAAPAVAAAVAAAARWRPLSGLMPLLASVSLGLAALYVLIWQYRFRYPPDFVWPQQFEAVHFLGAIAAVCLLADYAVTWMAGRASRRR